MTVCVCPRGEHAWELTPGSPPGPTGSRVGVSESRSSGRCPCFGTRSTARAARPGWTAAAERGPARWLRFPGASTALAPLAPSDPTPPCRAPRCLETWAGVRLSLAPAGLRGTQRPGPLWGWPPSAPCPSGGRERTAVRPGLAAACPHLRLLLRLRPGPGPALQGRGLAERRERPAARTEPRFLETPPEAVRAVTAGTTLLGPQDLENRGAGGMTGEARGPQVMLVDRPALAWQASRGPRPPPRLPLGGLSARLSRDPHCRCGPAQGGLAKDKLLGSQTTPHFSRAAHVPVLMKWFVLSAPCVPSGCIQNIPIFPAER